MAMFLVYQMVGLLSENNVQIKSSMIFMFYFTPMQPKNGLE